MVENFTLYLLLTSSIFWSSCVCQDDWRRRIVVGLYSACTNSTATSTNKVHAAALMHYKLVRRIIHEPCIHTTPAYPCLLNITYKGIDVCEDAIALTEIANDIILSNEYNNEQRLVIPGIGELFHYPAISKVFMIFCYLTQDLQKLLLQIFIKNKPSVVIFNPELAVSSTLSSFATVLNRPTENIEVLSHVLTLAKWEKLGFLHIKHGGESNATGDALYQVLFEQFEETLNTQFPDVCYFRDTIDLKSPSEVRKAAEKLQYNIPDSIIILLGDPKHQINFIREVYGDLQFHKHTWIVHDLKLPEKQYVDIGFAWNNEGKRVKVLSLTNPVRMGIASNKKMFVDDLKNQGYDTDVAYIQVEMLKRMVKNSRAIFEDINAGIHTLIKTIHIISGSNGEWNYMLFVYGVHAKLAFRVIGNEFTGPQLSLIHI